MFINNLTELCLEFVDHRISTLILQYNNICLHLLPHTTLNI